VFAVDLICRDMFLSFVAPILFIGLQSSTYLTQGNLATSCREQGCAAAPMRRESEVLIYSQNVRGLNEDKEESILSTMRRSDVFCYAIQETWREGDGIMENDGFTLIYHGSSKSTKGGRMSGGLCLVLNKAATKAWKAAGSEVLRFGNRTMAVRMRVTDMKKRPVDLLMVNSYAPIGQADEKVRAVFFEHLEICVNSKRSKEKLILAMDTNSSMGVRKSESDSVLGPYGVEHVNEAGREFYDFCSTNQLRAASTFFPKRRYQTWIHPCSRLGHQIDHFLVSKDSFASVMDCHTLGAQLHGSDHFPLRMKFRIARRLRKQHDPKTAGRINREKLRGPDCAKDFANKVEEKIIQSGQQCSYDTLVNAIKDAADENLRSEARRRPSWFEAQEEELRLLIQRRDTALSIYNMIAKELRNTVTKGGQRKMQNTLKKKKVDLQNARRDLQRGVRRAKQCWIDIRVEGMKKGAKDPRAYWSAVSDLRDGMSNSKPVFPLKFKKDDGSTCTTPKENAEVVQKHFHKLYNAKSNADESILDEVRQRTIREDMAETPNEEEIAKALKRAKDGKAAGDSGVPVGMVKALLCSDAIFSRFVDCVVEFWNTETCPDEWLVGVLKLIPKKGDLGDPNNWRGIMLLEVCSKVVGTIISERIQAMLGEIGLECQSGFSKLRGGSDARFSLKTGLQKRKEHGLGSWVLFVDLVKAFDTVPRDMLDSVLGKWVSLQNCGI